MVCTLVGKELPHSFPTCSEVFNNTSSFHPVFSRTTSRVNVAMESSSPPTSYKRWTDALVVNQRALEDMEQELAPDDPHNHVTNRLIGIIAQTSDILDTSAEGKTITCFLVAE